MEAPHQYTITPNTGPTTQIITSMPVHRVTTTPTSMLQELQEDTLCTWWVLSAAILSTPSDPIPTTTTKLRIHLTTSGTTQQEALSIILTTKTPTLNTRVVCEVPHIEILAPRLTRAIWMKSMFTVPLGTPTCRVLLTILKGRLGMFNTSFRQRFVVPIFSILKRCPCTKRVLNQLRRGVVNKNVLATICKAVTVSQRSHGCGQQSLTRDNWISTINLQIVIKNRLL